MGAKWVHRLVVNEDGETGECAKCGPVDVIWRKGKEAGAKQARCAVAIKEQKGHGRRTRAQGRGNPNRIGPHGLTGAEAREYRDKVGVCEICGRTDTLCVDHCHQTLELRGVLCRNCNLAIGLLRDDPRLLRAAIAYLSPP